MNFIDKETWVASVSCRAWGRGLLLLSVSLLAACSALKPVNLLNALVPSTGYTLQAGISYGDEQRQKLDIYLPETPADQSRLIVFVYGGAWRDGNRAEYEFVGQALADAGHTAIIPDYRLFPAVSYPAFISDIALAMTKARGVLEEQSGESLGQIVLMGHSSGAHTAALLASDSQWLEDSDIKVSALIAIAGPYDLPLDDPEVAPVFSGLTNADKVNPVTNVTAEHPPTLLIHGAKDERVLPFHTRHYAAALRAADVHVEVRWLEGEGHADSISGLATPLDSDRENRNRISEFLDLL